MLARSATGRENDNTERHQQHQDRLDASQLHSSIRNATSQHRESRDGHTPQPETSATQGSRGPSHEPARKRTKTGIITRNLPQTSCLRCKAKKIKCVPSDVVGGICKKYVSQGKLIEVGLVSWDNPVSQLTCPKMRVRTS